MQDNNIRYLLGNHAIARAISDCGVDVVAGYPGTPSSEIIEYLAKIKPGCHIEWSVNEKAAMEVAAGASWSGGRSAAIMKHVGLNVASDPFMTLAYTGVVGGMIVISADDPGCHSSQNEQDNRRYAMFAQIPCLDPAGPQEAYDMVQYAFELSEKFSIPVMLRPTTRVCHGKSNITLQEITYTKHPIAFEKNPHHWVMLPAHARVRHKQLIEKQEMIAQVLGSSQWNHLDIIKGTDIGIICSGAASVYTKESIEQLDIEVSLLKISTYPPPSGMIKKLLNSVKLVVVIEEMEPVIEDIIRSLSGSGSASKVEIHGKDIIPGYGELNVSIVSSAIASITAPTSSLTQDRIPVSLRKTSIALPERPPVMCPGCPHRATYYAMKKAFGSDAVFPGDIGCYTLGVRMGTMDTCLCMGSSITIASGIYHAGETKPICCSIGDSTFLHTGIPGLLNATYNNADITITILDNRTTAMTGHQPHPGTGQTVMGDIVPEASLEDIASACGVGFVRTTDPYDIESTIEVYAKARDHKGTSVVISKQECIITARRKGIKLTPFEVDPDKCSGCGLCIKFGCPAIQFLRPQEENEKEKETKKKKETAIISNICVGCGVCAWICPSNAILEVSK